MGFDIKFEKLICCLNFLPLMSFEFVQGEFVCEFSKVDDLVAAIVVAE